MTNDFYFDTSALIKHYHHEAGTAAVDVLLGTPGAFLYISRLTTVEMAASLAKKVRVGQASVASYRTADARFRGDYKARRFMAVRVLVRHYNAAETLIRRVGPTQNLRTLDAIQLAVALDLNRPGRPVTFVSADHALCGFAATEGLAVFNPVP